ncbi:hypothetical protein LC724_28305 [Blautia sp. RD014234]|nr:hypothetical protein [Blautia parvula]
MKNLGGENIDVKKIKQRIGTVLKSLLVLGVVLSGVLGRMQRQKGSGIAGREVQRFLLNVEAFIIIMTV